MDYKLDHVGVSVANLDAMVDWYANALNLEKRWKFEVPHVNLTGQFLVSEDGWAIELLHREGSGGGLKAPDPMTANLTHGYGHLCLRVKDVDEMFEQLTAFGAQERLSPRPSPEPGVRFAWVADPEGNLIELHDRKGPIGMNPESSK